MNIKNGWLRRNTNWSHCFKILRQQFYQLDTTYCTFFQHMLWLLLWFLLWWLLWWFLWWLFWWLTKDEQITRFVPSFFNAMPKNENTKVEKNTKLGCYGERLHLFCECIAWKSEQVSYILLTCFFVSCFPQDMASCSAFKYSLEKTWNLTLNDA